MSYVDPDFKSKKEFKAAVDRWRRYHDLIQSRNKLRPGQVGYLMDTETLHKEFPGGEPARLYTYNPSGMFPTPKNGSDVIEGPHYPKPHRWYAVVQVKDGYVVKVTG